MSFHSPLAINIATTGSYVGADNYGYSSEPSVGICNNESTIYPFVANFALYSSSIT